MMEEMDHGSVLCERYVYIHVKFFLKRTRTKKHIEHMCVCVLLSYIYSSFFVSFILFDTNLYYNARKNLFFQ